MAGREAEQPDRELRQWRFHWVQRIEWRSEGVLVEGGSRFDRSRDRIEVPYGALAMTETRTRSSASRWWLIVGLWAGVWGPVQWFLDGADEDVTVLIVLVALGAAAVLNWWARRMRWIGYHPVYVWDTGTRARAALDAVHRARCRSLVERNARNAISYTLDMVDQWVRAHYIDAPFADELRDLAKSVGYWPEGYL